MAVRQSCWIVRSAAIRALGLLALAIAVVLSPRAAAQSPAPSPGRALVDAIGIENIMTSPLHQQMLVFMRPLQEANKDRQQEVLEVFDKIIMPQAMLAFTADPVKDQIAKYYDQNFSPTELQELVAFFSTPVGKKFAEKNAALADGLPRLAVRLLVTVTARGALVGGVNELQKRGMTIPKAPNP